MRVEAKRFGASRRAWLCAVALSLAALAQGCLQSAPAPSGGGTAARPEALLAQATPARTAQPTPAQATPTAESPLPPPVGFVNDFAEVIDEETESQLEARLSRLKERTKIEIGVATVKTTGAQSVHDYSLAVARGWGIGPPAGEEGGGVLLLLASEDKRWRIQVTRSLEADLPDEVVGRIGAGMMPALREGRYGEAVNRCVDDLVRRLAERRGFSEQGERP
ncbi:MAG TPA: TPM domain-containing protein [Pyrinomonadaceae bacterium]